MRTAIATLLAACLLISLAVPVMAQSEEEMVAQFLKKAQKNQSRKMGFVVFNGMYGRLRTGSEYNLFTSHVNPLLSTAAGAPARIDGIYRSKEFYAGFGMMTTSRSSITIGATYWLNMGTTKTGDYDMTQLNLADTGPRYDYELKSTVRVFGVLANFDYYLLNPPDRQGVSKRLAVRIGTGGGLYFAKWQLWNGYTGYNLFTAAPETIDGNLSGVAPGFTATLAVEYPIPLGGFVVETAAQYLYLNFNRMKWYNADNEESVAVYTDDFDRVNLDLSGPRARFGLKRYFNW